MFADWNSIWKTLLELGPAGALLGVAILVFVFIGTFTDVFKNGTMRRWAVVISGTLFAGVEPGKVENAITAAIGIAVATSLKLLIEAVSKYLAERKKSK